MSISCGRECTCVIISPQHPLEHWLDEEDLLQLPAFLGASAIAILKMPMSWWGGVFPINLNGVTGPGYLLILFSRRYAISCNGFVLGLGDGDWWFRKSNGF